MVKFWNVSYVNQVLRDNLSKELERTEPSLHGPNRENNLTKPYLHF